MSKDAFDEKAANWPPGAVERYLDLHAGGHPQQAVELIEGLEIALGFRNPGDPGPTLEDQHRAAQGQPVSAAAAGLPDPNATP